MKLIEVLEPINEALRFTNKSAREILERSNEFRIGIEYEFHPEGDDGDDEFDDEDIIEIEGELIDNFIENNYQEMREMMESFSLIDRIVDNSLYKQLISNFLSDSFETYAEFFYNNRRSIDLYLDEQNTQIDAFGLSDDQEEEIKEFLAQTYFFFNLFYFVFKSVDSITDFIGSGGVTEDALARLFSYDFLSHSQSIDTEYSTIRNLVKTEFSFITPYHVEDLDDIIEDLTRDNLTSEIIENVIRRVNEEFINEVENFVDAIEGENADISDLSEIMADVAREDGEFADEAQTRADERREQSNNIEQKVYNEIGHIEKVENEHDDQKEIITQALPIKEAFSVMEDMHEFIKENGHTTDKSGMHVNISHQGFSTENLNILKMLLFLDVNFFQNLSPTGSTNNKFPVRNHVGTMFRLFPNRPVDLDSGSAMDNDIVRLADTFVETGDIDEMAEELSFKLRREKYTAVNLTTFIPQSNMSRNRLEFRFFGGEDYEFRTEEIQRDILNACYVILAAYDEDFLRREYIEAIIRFMNTVIDEMTFYHNDKEIDINTFSELVSFRKKQK